MKYLSFGVILLTSAVGITAQTPADKANDATVKAPITLTGCVAEGTAPGSFVLTHVVRSDSSTSASSAMPQPSVSNPTATPPIATPPATPPTEEPKPTAAPPSTEPAPTATSGTDAAANGAIYSLDSPDKVKAHLGHKVAVTGTLEDDMDKATTKDKADKTGGKQENYKVKVKSVKMISSSCS